MEKNNNKNGIIIFILTLIVVGIGISYAYYSAVVQGTGNANAEASGKTATIGEVEFNDTSTFDSSTLDEIYPGFIGIQEFTISPYKDGTGIYEVDLQATVPSQFGSDIRITIYKTSDKTNNNVTRTEGTLTITDNQYTKQDILTINGVLEKAYEDVLTTTSEEMLEQVKFVISNNVFTTPITTPDDYYTYYAVYEYLDNGNQNNQQGLNFSSKITVKYVTENEYNGASYLTSLVANATKGSLDVIDNGIMYDTDGETELCTNTMAYDDYGNLRYVGANPCNYVTFNGEEPSVGHDQYGLYIDGVFNSYDTLESCNSSLSSATNMGLSGECVYNSDTQKYDARIYGFISYFSFNSMEECQNSSYYEEMSGSGLSTSCLITNKAIIEGGWRIIGIIDGKIKLVRNDSIGEYSWDSSEQSVNGGYGINQWGESGSYRGADLMKLLNPGYEDNTDSTYSCVYNETTKQNDCELINNSILINNSLYWNKTSGKCYNENYNQSVDCDFTETGLTSDSKLMIDNHIWFLGAVANSELNTGIKQIYDIEHDNVIGKECSSGDMCNDNVERTTRWIGYVGLTSISDVGYAIGGQDRVTCLNNVQLNTSTAAGCFDNDWIKGANWSLEGLTIRVVNLLNPVRRNNGYGVYTFSNMANMTRVMSGSASEGLPVTPSLFLKSNVKISGGEGTPTNPYTLTMN